MYFPRISISERAPPDQETRHGITYARSRDRSIPYRFFIVGSNPIARLSEILRWEARKISERKPVNTLRVNNDYTIEMKPWRFEKVASRRGFGGGGALGHEPQSSCTWRRIGKVFDVPQCRVVKGNAVLERETVLQLCTEQLQDECQSLRASWNQTLQP